MRAIKVIVAFFVFSLCTGIVVAAPMPVSISFTSSASTALMSGDTFSVTATLNDSITFDSLDAVLNWNTVYLTPIDLVTADPFLTLGGLFTGTSFGPGPGGYYSNSLTPGSLTINLVSYNSETITGPGSLFSLTFRVNTGVLPASTLVEFGSLAAYPNNGLALPYLDWDTFESTEYLASPDPLSITLANQEQHNIPEPGIIELVVLGGLLSRRFVRFSISA